MSLIRFLLNLNSSSHWAETAQILLVWKAYIVCWWIWYVCMPVGGQMVIFKVLFKCVSLLLLSNHFICSLRFSQLVRNLWLSEILSIFSWKCSLPINYWINSNLTTTLKATLCSGSFISISSSSVSPLLASIRIESLPHRSADFYINLSWDH